MPSICVLCLFRYGGYPVQDLFEWLTFAFRTCQLKAMDLERLSQKLLEKVGISKRKILRKKERTERKKKTCPTKKKSKKPRTRP